MKSIEALKNSVDLVYEKMAAGLEVTHADLLDVRNEAKAYFEREEPKELTDEAKTKPPVKEKGGK